MGLFSKIKNGLAKPEIEFRLLLTNCLPAERLTTSFMRNLKTPLYLQTRVTILPKKFSTGSKMQLTKNDKVERAGKR